MKEEGRSGRIIRSMFLPMLLCSAALIGCTSNSSEIDSAANILPNHPPSVRVAMILPNPIVLGEPVRVHADGNDPDGDPVTFRQQWFVNGKPVSDETGTTLSSSMFVRGDRVSVEVVPLDGKTEGASSRAEQVVGNSLPMVTRVTLDPAQLQIGSPVQAKVEASDADRDEIRFTFKWWRNGTLVKEGAEDILDTAGFARKDTIVVEVTPRDEAGQGKPFVVDPVVIGNSPPRIVSTPSSAIGQGSYEYTVQAKDLDGDSLSYVLETAPPGMTIEKATGKIVWPIAPDLNGTHRVRVVAEDGEGGSAFQEFEISLPAAHKPS